MGLNYSIGEDGFLSDGTGEGFAILVLLGLGIGFYLCLKDNRQQGIKKNCRNKLKFLLFVGIINPVILSYFFIWHNH